MPHRLPAALLLALCALALAAEPVAAPAHTASPVASWVGSYTLVGPDALAVSVAAGRATVTLGPGHAEAQTVAWRRTGARVRFQLPGRPQPVVFSGRIRGRRLAGTVRQGAAKGTFRLRPGSAPALVARGLYDVAGGVRAVVDDPYGPARLVDLDSGEVHALYADGRRFAVGAGFAAREPAVGRSTFGERGGTILGAPAARIAVRRLEVRFAGGGAVLAGTLSVPGTPGRHPAVAFVHGSGATPRAYLPDLQALLLRHGVAVLAYDKRGVGQSRGRYPGESPAPEAIDVLARDAQAAARFLAAQPEIDPARVGLAGHSQAGWIMPLAATREPAVRFLVVFSGPAVTADENDRYQDLAGEGVRPQGLTDAEVDTAVLAAGPGGFDPLPSIRSLRVPALWLYGGLDKHVPPRLSLRRLEPLAGEPGRDFSLALFPHANHALVETQTGLTAEMLRSDSFAPGLFASVGAWLRAHGLAAG